MGMDGFVNAANCVISAAVSPSAPLFTSNQNLNPDCTIGIIRVRPNGTKARNAFEISGGKPNGQ